MTMNAAERHGEFLNSNPAVKALFNRLAQQIHTVTAIEKSITTEEMVRFLTVMLGFAIAQDVHRKVYESPEVKLNAEDIMKEAGKYIVDGTDVYKFVVLKQPIKGK